MKNRVIIIGVISLLFTIASPFVFNAYFEKKPEESSPVVPFGGPFPFAKQSVTLPADENDYPIEVTFTSPLEKDVEFLFVPFILSFLFFYLFFFSLYSIIIRFFSGIGKRRTNEEDPEN
ncbi:hypothetical protein LS684_07365 [Cytobacillus spongiae]|uniref:hypothetical protein n=1 Tax=Cytobacillus spongiae TaxID=2901381 RepID=UPI001F392ED3|nr:hypothetical protein [Cytobacillus spongiae]UII57250.1 hypothetical protein LS684_07365 [Cytobacillus spongiae]